MIKPKITPISCKKTLNFLGENLDVWEFVKTIQNSEAEIAFVFGGPHYVNKSILIEPIASWFFNVKHLSRNYVISIDVDRFECFGSIICVKHNKNTNYNEKTLLKIAEFFEGLIEFPTSFYKRKWEKRKRNKGKY